MKFPVKAIHFILISIVTLCLAHETYSQGVNKTVKKYKKGDLTGVSVLVSGNPTGNLLHALEIQDLHLACQAIDFNADPNTRYIIKDNLNPGPEGVPIVYYTNRESRSFFDLALDNYYMFKSPDLFFAFIEKILENGYDPLSKEYEVFTNRKYANSTFYDFDKCYRYLDDPKRVEAGVKIMKLCIENSNMDINYEQGRLLRYLIVSYPNTEFIKYCLDKGANPFLVSTGWADKKKNSTCAYKMAKSKGYTELVALFDKYKTK